MILTNRQLMRPFNLPGIGVRSRSETGRHHREGGRAQRAGNLTAMWSLTGAPTPGTDNGGYVISWPIVAIVRPGAARGERPSTRKLRARAAASRTPGATPT